MIFRDRFDSGRRLAEALASFRGKDVVVLALPRGGVAVALEVAKALGAPLDLIVARKIGHPMSPEYAIGAIAEDGELVLNPDEASRVPESWLRAEIGKQAEKAKRRRQVYSGGRGMPDVRGRTAILVDDGIATGYTVVAAVRSLRKRGASRVVVAAPIAPPDTVERLRREADEVVVLNTPEPFTAIGAFYLDFSPLDDDRVLELLGLARRPPASHGSNEPRRKASGHWEHFSHGADIGVRGVGPTIETAFEQGAVALVAVLVEPEKVEPLQAVGVACESRDLEVLFVDWLNAIVFEMATRNMVFARFEVHIEQRAEQGRSDSEKRVFHLAATAWGEPVEVERHQPKVEVKGATFTCLSVRRQGENWIAECVVDV